LTKEDLEKNPEDWFKNLAGDSEFREFYDRQIKERWINPNKLTVIE